MAKETPAKAVTGSNPKARKNKKPDLYFSKKDVVPFNDVWNGKEMVTGLTEEQRIAEGLRQPFVQTPNFSKNEAERKAWKKVHTNAKFPQGWISASANSHSYTKHTLIVHLINHKKDPEFKTTYTFKEVKENEISRIFDMIIKLDKRNKFDSYMNHIVKYHYRGVTVNGLAKS